MANTITINSTAFNGLADDPIQGAGSFICYPPIAEGPTEHGPEYRILTIPVVGSNTVLTKNLGFTGRDIDVNVIHLDTSLSAAYGRKTTVVTAMGSSRFNIVWHDGSTFYACMLKPNGAIDQRVFALNTLTALIVRYSFRQMSLT